VAYIIVEEAISYMPAAVLQVDMSQAAFVAAMAEDIVEDIMAADIMAMGVTVVTAATVAMEAMAIARITAVGAGVLDWDWA